MILIEQISIDFTQLRIQIKCIIQMQASTVINSRALYVYAYTFREACSITLFQPNQAYQLHLIDIASSIC